LQQVALDNATVTSFEDVCTDDGDGYLSCTGNIEQFGCYRYGTNYYSDFTNLSPAYPIITCYKKDGSAGVYLYKGTDTSSSAYTGVHYIVIRDGFFQLITALQEFQKIYQPISNIAEAKDYFIATGKASFVDSDVAIDSIQNAAKAGTYYVTDDKLQKSTVIETENNFIINSYSHSSLGTFSCANDLYSLTFLLDRDGSLFEQDKTLVWEINDPPACTK